MSRSIVPEHRRGRTARGVAATVVLAGLVLGVPFALVTLAGGPSLHLDPGGLWQAALHRRPGDIRTVTAWLGRAAVLFAWIGWAWLTICVALEARSWWSGRTTVRLPGSRTLQWVAAVLVGTAFAIGTSGRVPAPRVVAEGIHASPARSEGFRGPDVTGAGDHGSDSRDNDGRTAGIRVLSDALPPDDDREPSGLRDAARRLTSTAVAGVGRVDRPIGDIGTATPRGDHLRATHRVAHRETLWSIAGSQLGDARRWREIAELNYDVVQSDGLHLTRDHWIQSGWELLLPEHGGPARVPTEPVHEPRAVQVVPVADGPTNVPTSRSTAADRTSGLTAHRLVGGSPVPITPVAPFGAGIVGVGVADLVDRLRRVQQRHRALGERIRPSDPVLRNFEQRLRVGDGRAELDAAEAGVEAALEGLDRRDAARRLQQVWVGDTSVRLRFDAPLEVDPCAPVTRGADQATLVVRRADLVKGAPRRWASRRQFPSPTLVALGRGEEELMMINLEGVGSLVLAGDPLANESVGRALALELATSRWSSAFDLVLVGFGAGMERCERVTVVADAGPVSADMTWRRLTTGMRLQELGLPAVDVARRSETATAWQPVVVICGPEVPAAEAQTLIDAGEDGRSGIGIVVIGGSGATTPDGCVVVRPSDADLAGQAVIFGNVTVPQRCDEDDAERAVALIGAAAEFEEDRPGSRQDGPSNASTSFDRLAGDGSEDSVVTGGGGRLVGTSPEVRTTPYGHVSERSTARVDATSTVLKASPGQPQGCTPHIGGGSDRPGRTGDTEVEVAVLGPVEIRGAARGFTRAWAAELVVYLALHPGGAANETWATALWPERLMAPSSLHSTASVARRSLGRARDGSDHLPRSHGRLQLAPTVGTDWDRFLALAESEDPDRWHDALSLVRGRPFEGSRSTDWTILDGTAPAIESTVVDLSGRLAGACLRAGDARGAEWAARRGLLVSPYDERLYRMLLRAADAAGNPEGVETVMSELVRVVADEIEPIESVHPATLALYRSLSRRTDRSGRAAVRP